jgi:hypothetical protein
MWVYNPVLSSSIFIHRRVLDQHGLFFETRWRALGDMMWTIAMERRGLNMKVLRRFTSSFTDTGDNLCLTPSSLRETETVKGMAPAWVRRCTWQLHQLHRLRSLFHGIYWQKPFTYSIYTLDHPDRRVDFPVARPTAIWWKRH